MFCVSEKSPSLSFHNALMLACPSEIVRTDEVSDNNESSLVGNMEAGNDAFCTTRMSPNVLPLLLGPSSFVK